MNAIIPEDVRRALTAIVEYDWERELEDYADNYPECQGGHVFEHLVVVDNWLKGRDVAPEAYLPDHQAADGNNDAGSEAGATMTETNGEE